MPNFLKKLCRRQARGAEGFVERARGPGCIGAYQFMHGMIRGRMEREPQLQARASISAQMTRAIDKK